MGFITAKERDAEWLEVNKLSRLNLDRFSDWVTRQVDAGMSDEKARGLVSKAMLRELES